MLLITRAALTIFDLGMVKAAAHFHCPVNTLLKKYYKKEQGLYFYILCSLRHPYLNDIGNFPLSEKQIVNAYTPNKVLYSLDRRYYFDGNTV